MRLRVTPIALACNIPARNTLARNILAVIALSIGLTATIANASPCAPTAVDLRGDWGQAHFTVEIADDAQEQAKGLMFRERLAASAGMLFTYKSPHHAVFWMQNVPISLDMVFVDQAGVVTHVAHNARPFDESRIDGGEDVLMILEINGGMAKALGISIGTELRHPGLDSSIAAWPCPLE